MDDDDSSRLRQGLVWGGLGLLVFSVTLPATRAAVPELGALAVGLGRGVVAAALSGLVLLAMRERLPARRHWLGLVIVALGVVIGFPLFTALAMRLVPSSHGAVVIGLIPAATAIAAVFRAGERPGVPFWIGCGAGTLAVILFAVVEGAGRPQLADLLLLAAVISAGVSYAEGGRLAREIGAWRVICWSSVLCGPLLAIPAFFALPAEPATISARAWFGFAWVAVGSSFLGFFAWYRGLALGGVARVGQIQLLQPVMALGWSALLLGEAITTESILCSLLVLASVGICLKTGRPRTAAERPAPEKEETFPAVSVATCCGCRE